jgi:environmental stress-induced protein Ves
MRQALRPEAGTGIVWRLGRTQIVTPGPFSDLSGLDRILTVIGGRGLMLDVAGGPSLDVREPLKPVRFRGEDRIMSRLEAGPVDVLNLIADRRRAAIDVVILKDTGAHALKAGTHVVYAIAESEIAIGGETAVLPGDHALRIDAAARVQMKSGCVAVATIVLRWR